MRFAEQKYECTFPLEHGKVLIALPHSYFHTNQVSKWANPNIRSEVRLKAPCLSIILENLFSPP